MESLIRRCDGFDLVDALVNALRDRGDAAAGDPRAVFEDYEGGIARELLPGTSTAANTSATTQAELKFLDIASGPAFTGAVVIGSRVVLVSRRCAWSGPLALS